MGFLIIILKEKILFSFGKFDIKVTLDQLQKHK